MILWSSTSSVEEMISRQKSVRVAALFAVMILTQSFRFDLPFASFDCTFIHNASTSVTVTTFGLASMSMPFPPSSTSRAPPPSSTSSPSPPIAGPYRRQRRSGHPATSTSATTTATPSPSSIPGLRSIPQRFAGTATHQC